MRVRGPWLAGGAALLLATAVGPLADAAAVSFVGHMTRHMLLVTLVPMALVAGVAGTAWDPVTRLPRLGAPLVASLVDLVVVWLWHLPAWHHAARHNWEAALIEHVMFLGGGLWLWAAVLGGPAARRRAAAGESLIALVLTFAHMTMLGALLGLAPRPFVVHGLPLATALADQQRGAAVMLGTSAVVYVGAGLWLGRRILRAAPLREAVS